MVQDLGGSEEEGANEVIFVPLEGFALQFCHLSFAHRTLDIVCLVPHPYMLPEKVII